MNIIYKSGKGICSHHVLVIYHALVKNWALPWINSYQMPAKKLVISWICHSRGGAKYNRTSIIFTLGKIFLIVMFSPTAECHGVSVSQSNIGLLGRKEGCVILVWHFWFVIWFFLRKIHGSVFHSDPFWMPVFRPFGSLKPKRLSSNMTFREYDNKNTKKTSPKKGGWDSIPKWWDRPSSCGGWTIRNQKHIYLHI